MIPHNDLPQRRPYLDPNPSEKTEWLPQPQPGTVAQIELYFWKPSMSSGSWRPADAPGKLNLATLKLSRSGSFHIVRWDRPILPSEEEDIQMRRSAYQPVPNENGEPFGFSGFTVQSHQAGGPILIETQHGM